jgi:hypothetical protein
MKWVVSAVLAFVLYAVYIARISRKEGLRKKRHELELLRREIKYFETECLSYGVIIRNRNLTKEEENEYGEISEKLKELREAEMAMVKEIDKSWGKK